MDEDNGHPLPDWEQFRRSMGYSESDLTTFRSYPANEYAIENSWRLDKWWVVAEVIEAHGCAAGHRVGDKLYFASGMLETRLCPERICLAGMVPLSTAVAVFNERIISGLVPDPHLFGRVGCLDVGIQCGGWGHVSFRLYAQERE